MLEEVARVSLNSENRIVAIVALSRLGSILVQRGSLYEAQERFQQAVEVASQNRKEPLPAVCEAMFGLGKIHWEWYDFETAKRYLLAGIEHCKRWRETTSVEGWITLAFLCQSQGTGQAARQALERAVEITSRNIYTRTGKQYVASQEAYLDFRQGNYRAAGKWAAKRELDQYLNLGKLESIGSMGADVIRNYELVVFVRILMARKQAESAYGLLCSLLPVLEPLHHKVKIIEIHLLSALALKALGKKEHAIEAIHMALEVAAPQGFRRIFLDEGPEVLSLLKEIDAGGTHAEFTRILLAAWRGESGETPPAGRKAGLIEPLTEREREVLRLLQSDLSAPEIAGQIHISVSTLRTHIRNIYAKLGVHSRFEAITTAKETGLI